MVGPLRDFDLLRLQKIEFHLQKVGAKNGSWSKFDSHLTTLGARGFSNAVSGFGQAFGRTRVGPEADETA